MSAGLESAAAREASFLSWIYRQLFVKPPAPPASISLSDQTAIVTGANTGLGFECARQLLKIGLSHLVVAVRSQLNGDAAASQLRSEFPKATIDVLILDMESYDSIMQFSRRCRALPRLDIVILNAGVTRQNFERNPCTKHETVLQVNYLSTALLAILLVPLLKSKRDSPHPARLTVVGSDMSHWASFPDAHADPLIPSLDDVKNFKPMERYPLSKLMEQFFVMKLSEHVSPDHVVVNLVNPGFCTGTSLNRDGSHPWLNKVLGLTVARTTVDGARAYIDAAVLKGKESHGSYVSDGMIKPYPKIVYTTLGKELEEKLWRETMAEFEFAGAVGIVDRLM